MKSCLSERVKCVEDPLDRGKNQNPKKSLGLPTNPRKTPGPKITPKKSHVECPSLKNFRKELNDITRKIGTSEIECLCLFIKLSYAATTTNLQIVLYPENPILNNQATPKTYLPSFPAQNIPESKISIPKKSFDYPRHLKSGVLTVLHGKTGNSVRKSNSSRHSVWESSENMGCFLRRCNFSTLFGLFS